MNTSFSITQKRNEPVATKNEFVLVKGDFSVEEAKDAIIGLVEDKIRHHRERNFSLEERFGMCSEHSSLRIGQLQEDLAEIQKMLQLAESQGKTVRIRADIKMELI